MPRIFDNIEDQLLPALRQTLELSHRADFSVGYFNLRGWRGLADQVDRWAGGEGQQCRVLIGMQRTPDEEIHALYSLASSSDGVDQQEVLRLKKKLADQFRRQLTIGAPTNADEIGLRRLRQQLMDRKVVVKLFLRHPLHAKLYLAYRDDPISPIVGFVGSSNLTTAGLSRQGELNVDVLDYDACSKLQRWFEERWNDRWCLDITQELADLIDESWAREEIVPPYHIYLKMAYHLSREAQTAISEFSIPRDFGSRLFEFQVKAVQIGAHHVNRREGVLIGDVVGLGKTLMATALARIMQDDHGYETLIICPKNLVKMWQDYVDRYRLIARVMPITQVQQELPQLRRYRLVLIDESHNLRNREGRRYKAIADYIDKNDSKCILLSATPYNKSYLDLGAQLALFVDPSRDLGIRPETVLRKIGETEFIRRHQCPVRSLAAFEKSDEPDDWRELMRLYMVRRTRSFIKENYAHTDPATGRKYLTYEDGTRSYFPDRVPKTVKFKVNERDKTDPYVRMYSDDIVSVIGSPATGNTPQTTVTRSLSLARYGLGEYKTDTPAVRPTAAEEKVLAGLGRAGKRLVGFCRTNLYKRLESGGPAFIQSVERHVLRNFVVLYALKNGLDIPIGTQAAEDLDTAYSDEDDSNISALGQPDDDGSAAAGDGSTESDSAAAGLRDESAFRTRAAAIYSAYKDGYAKRFKWLRSSLFKDTLAEELLRDSRQLIDVLKSCGSWDPARDAKLNALEDLLKKTHPTEKVLIFTQFADTARYLGEELTARGLTAIESVTGDHPDPTGVAWRFSPESNEKRDRIQPEDELRVLISTDVLSEGQNLQDCSIIVSYDLPWAIIRLVQRAGRVDRIGQRSERILCYSFLPADGIERLIDLRGRVGRRLRENAEVVGTDEAFFEDDDRRPLLDLYNENAGIYDAEADTEVDLASFAYQIWKNAIDADPSLESKVRELPDVVYSARPHRPTEGQPEGVLVYMRTGDGNDALAWMDTKGDSVTQSQLAVLRAAECKPDTSGLTRDPQHHELVQKGVEHMLEEEKQSGGQLGRPSGARFKTYERLKGHAADVQGTLFDTPELHKAIEEVYKYPLLQTATDTLNRQLKAGVTNQELADLVVQLRADGRLCQIHDDGQQRDLEPRIICSMGLFQDEGGRNG
jgi:superfamily II DNA or RNA helicase